MSGKTREINTRTLYALENDELPTGHAFADFEALKKFSADVVASEHFRLLTTNSGPFKVQVFSNGDRNFSEAELPNKIWIANDHWYPSIVLHELAHLAVHDGYHTKEFLSTYLALIRSFMGDHALNQFSNAFQREGLM